MERFRCWPGHTNQYVSLFSMFLLKYLKGSLPLIIFLIWANYYLSWILISLTCKGRGWPARSVCPHSFNSRWTSTLWYEGCPSSISLDLQLHCSSRSQPRSIFKACFSALLPQGPIFPNSPTVESTAFLYVYLISPQHVEELRRRSWEETQNRAPAADSQGQGPYSKCFLISHIAWHWAGAGSSVWGTWDCPGLTSRSMLGKVTRHSGKLQPPNRSLPETTFFEKELRL